MRAALAVALIVLAAAPACSVGLGSAYVGQWRARDEVELEVCVEDGAGRCVERRAVVRRVEARRFSGSIVSLPAALGVSTMSSGGRRDAAFTVLPSFEHLRGEGHRALGLRVGALLLAGGGRSIVGFPITGFAHRGLSERLALYGGGGLLPLTVEVDDEGAVVASSYLGLQGAGGLRIALSRAQETRLVLSLEASATWFGLGGLDGAALGLTSHLGFYF